jgi:hypothetical protein
MISSQPTMLVWTPVVRDACEGLLEAAPNHFVTPRTVLLPARLV